MVKRKLISRSSQNTRKIGFEMAKKILAEKKDGLKALVLALYGDLGAGKTTFLQGFAKGLSIKEKITSPTFVIQKRFGLNNKKFKNFYHFDCYRIKKPEEMLELNFKEIISDPKNIVAIEWPSRIEKVLPEKIIIMKFEFINDKEREVLCYNKGY